jgi:hypothetical protein
LVGDKTGSGEHNTVNDIAIPSGRSPILPYLLAHPEARLSDTKKKNW